MLQAKKNFTDEDKKAVIAFLNFVATHAKFESVDTKFIIEGFKHLNYMQQVLVPKINANIVEVAGVGTMEPDKEQPKPTRGRKAAK
jgi:hypothetical protein